MKKTNALISLFLLLYFPMVSYADNGEVASPTNLSPRFQIGVELLYLQPTNSHLAYALSVPTTPNESQHYDYINPIYKPDFRLYSNVYFTEQVDMGLNWTHVRNTQTAYLSGENNVTLPGEYPNYDKVDGTAELALDTVNVEFGYRLTPKNQRLRPRIHLGLQFLNIDNQLVSKGSRQQTDYFSESKTQSTFAGLGVRIGSDGEYFLGENMSVTGAVAASLLYGQNTWKQTVTEYAILYPEPQTNYTREAVRNTVRGIEGRVGLKYVTRFLAIEGGYQIASYTDSVRDAERAYHSMGYQGPYLSVSWQS